VAGGVTLSGPRAHAIIETVLGSLSALTDLAMLSDDAKAATQGAAKCCA